MKRQLGFSIKYSAGKLAGALRLTAAPKLAAAVKSAAVVMVLSLLMAGCSSGSGSAAPDGSNSASAGNVQAAEGLATGDAQAVQQQNAAQGGTASTAQGGTASPTPTGTASPAPTGTASPAPAGTQSHSQDTIVLKLASTLSPDMGTLQKLEEMSRTVSEKTEGRVDIQIYPSSKLGDQVDYIQAIEEGTVEMCLVASTALESLDPHFLIFGIPAAFRTPESVNLFYRSEICQNMLENFRAGHNIRALGLYHDGLRNLWLKNIEVQKASDLKGLRLRVPDVELRKTEFQKLGAETIPLPLSDCYVALQSGYIDGMENNVETIMSSGLSDQLNYQIKTGHAYSSLLLLINETAFQSMTAEDQKVFLSAVERCENEAFRDYLKSQEAAEKAAEAAGIETIELSDAEKKKIDTLLLEAIEPLLKGLYPDNIYDLIRAM